MSGSPWFRFFSRTTKATRRRTEGFARTTSLFLEVLEDRTVLAPLQAVSPLNATLPPSDSAGGVSQVKLSANGQYIVYTSNAPNLALFQVTQSVGTNVFLYDTVAGTTTVVSHNV